MKTLIMVMAMFLLSAMARAEYVSLSSDVNSARDIEVLQTGRYSHVKNIPPVDQINPLKVVVKTRVPQSIDTVRQTVEYLLARSGYVLADDSVLSSEALSLLSLPLPQIHRELGPMTLDKALHTLSGEAFELVVDPVHRKVAYVLASSLVRSR